MFCPRLLQIDPSMILDQVQIFFFCTRCMMIIMIFLRSWKSNFMTNYGCKWSCGCFSDTVCVEGEIHKGRVKKKQENLFSKNSQTNMNNISVSIHTFCPHTHTHIQSCSFLHYQCKKLIRSKRRKIKRKM